MKTLLPVIIAFAVFTAIVLCSSLVQSYQIADMGEGDLHSFMACFYYFGPLFFVVALLTQWLIVVPLFNGFDTVTAKLSGITDLLTACLFAAATFAYAIWDSIDGLDSYIGLFSRLTMIQLAYWVMNLSVMFLFSVRLKRTEENTIQKEV